MKLLNRRGALHPQLRRFLTLGCAAALFVAYGTQLDHRGDGVGHVPFLELDAQVVVQRRKHETSPGDVLLSGLLHGALPLAALGVWADLDPRCLVVLLAGYLHLRVFPCARWLAFEAADTLDEYRQTLAQINRYHVWMVVVGTSLLLASDLAHLRGGDGLPMLLGAAVAPQTLRPGNLTSTSRNGVVDHYRVRTAHTDTHHVVEIRQPLTLSIPRSDPDQADLVMVLLHQGTASGGGRYLDQATIGQIFRLSRQRTNFRIALYKRRERITDVLSHERDNFALKEPVVNAIHQLLLSDPFIGPTAVRQHLVEQGLFAKAKDISLSSVTRAMQTVDYIAVRERIQELMHRGELVADHEKLSRLLLQEMSQLAAAAGKKIGQHVLTAVQIVGLQVPSVPLAPAASAEKPMGYEDTHLLPVPGAANSRVPPAWREVFYQYFSFGASYQELASAHGVWASTIYRRLVVIHSRLPSLQTVLGKILFSGIVCVDEKYILAPKEYREDKGKMARWVYLFIAIDPYTYDLLHAEVYPDRTAACARAFLLGLTAKGVVKPKVIVTDLWGPYETVVPEVYPGATHHQCVFHAEQAVSDLMKDKLGSEYRTAPEAKALHKAIVHLFRAGCRRTLGRRYQKLLQLREPLLARRPELISVFDSVDRHFQKVANAYSDRRLKIPRTNNAVERVIRCFTRRYKTMAGFETLETARAYVRLWSYYYRFRPFSPDANPGIRRRSPLEIAGYPVAGLTCLDLVMPPPPME